MSDYVPFSISTENLDQLLNEAKTREEQKLPENQILTDFEVILEMAAKVKAELFEATHNPLAMKMLALMISEDMIAYHRRFAQIMREREPEREDQIDTWNIDAGKWITIRDTMLDIEITAHDPTPRWKD